MQKENTYNVEYVFLPTVRKLNPGSIRSCHSILNTFPAVLGLGKYAGLEKLEQGSVPQQTSSSKVTLANILVTFHSNVMKDFVKLNMA